MVLGEVEGIACYVPFCESGVSLDPQHHRRAGPVVLDATLSFNNSSAEVKTVVAAIAFRMGMKIECRSRMHKYIQWDINTCMDDARVTAENLCLSTNSKKERICDQSKSPFRARCRSTRPDDCLHLNPQNQFFTTPSSGFPDS